MADYKSLSVSECVERLIKVERPLLVMHANPDADTVGSCAALKDILEMMGKNVKYLCADEIPRRLRFLVEGFEQAESLEGLSPITVDVASPEMLGRCREVLTGDLAPVLMIDHHESGKEFADCYKIPGASSVGEVMFDIAEQLEKMGKIKFTKALAGHLYAAISSDTGSFRYQCATADTYVKAARLLRLGIDHAKISHQLYFSKDDAQIRAEGLAAANLKTALNGKIAYSYITNEQLQKHGLSRLDFDTAIDVVRSLFGVEIALFAKETADSGSFKVSLRSTGIDVSRVAEALGGGGHVMAAGCTVRAESAEAAINTVIDKILSICK